MSRVHPFTLVNDDGLCRAYSSSLQAVRTVEGVAQVTWEPKERKCLEGSTIPMTGTAVLKRSLKLILTGKRATPSGLHFKRKLEL